LDVAQCARDTLAHMSATRVPLTPDNYLRCYADTARRLGLVVPNAFADELKGIIALLLQRLRDFMPAGHEEVSRLLGIESAIPAISDEGQAASAKQELVQAIEGISTDSQLADMHLNEAMRSALDVLVEMVVGQVKGGGVIKEQLEGHAVALERVVKEHPESEITKRIETVVEGVRGTLEDVASRQQEAVRTLETSQDEIQHLRAELQRRKEEATLDELTKIYNRRGFNAKLEEEVARFSRYQTSFSLIIFDIDHFKRFNDTYGHQAGDAVLETLAEVVQKCIRRTDFFARYGGEEFAIIAGGTKLQPAAALAEKVRQHVADIAFVYDEETISVTISCGVAEFVEGDTAATIIRRSDTALYQAKAGGRNAVCS